MEPEQINQFAIVHRWLGAPGTYCYGSRRSDAYGLNRNSKVHIVALQTLTHKRLRLQPGHSLCGLAPEKLEGIDFGGSGRFDCLKFYVQPAKNALQISGCIDFQKQQVFWPGQSPILPPTEKSSLSVMGCKAKICRSEFSSVDLLCGLKARRFLLASAFLPLLRVGSCFIACCLCCQRSYAGSTGV